MFASLFPGEVLGVSTLAWTRSPHENQRCLEHDIRSGAASGRQPYCSKCTRREQIGASTGRETERTKGAAGDENGTGEADHQPGRERSTVRR